MFSSFDSNKIKEIEIKTLIIELKSSCNKSPSKISTLSILVILLITLKILSNIGRSLY